MIRRTHEPPRLHPVRIRYTLEDLQARVSLARDHVEQRYVPVSVSPTTFDRLQSFLEELAYQGWPFDRDRE